MPGRILGDPRQVQRGEDVEDEQPAPLQRTGYPRKQLEPLDRRQGALVTPDQGEVEGRLFVELQVVQHPVVAGRVVRAGMGDRRG